VLSKWRNQQVTGFKDWIDADRVKIHYTSLGTFEFLANPTTKQFYFLEINPRLQVEHTITETIFDTDLVRAQLLIAQGASLSSILPRTATQPPARYGCQLRITAEDVTKNWSLSIGKLTEVKLPSGNGVRVDAALEVGQIIGSAFDSLLAKVIVSDTTWPLVVQKARRALEDTSIEGVRTNIDILRGILASPEFEAGDCNTTWLERNQDRLLKSGLETKRPLAVHFPQTPSTATSSVSSSAPVFRKGDSWTLNLKPLESNESAAHHLSITRILRNDFPTSLAAQIEFTSPGADSIEYELNLTNTLASASAVTSHHRRGDPTDARHVIIPFPGTLVEVFVDEGDRVKTDDVICVVRQMKMEIEIRAKRGGRVTWVTEVEDGEEVNEGVLAAIIEQADEAKL
jgi:pyruvate carboxylase